ncbi:MAG TPA: DUF2332 domain-containing protein [Longimicrobium sp.]|nr:DUF2332 domain-containing protein [Longimicrobium sp.]
MSKASVGLDPSFDPIRQRYLAFAENEAKGVSPLYEELARAVAESAPLLNFIASLPAPKQQPNLVFAAVRHLYGTPEDARHFEDLVARHPEPIRRLVLARSTQTNEPGRCAVLLPVLARLPQPLALLEVGASAGLCLLPDLYGYDYGRKQIPPRRAAPQPAPVFPCHVDDRTPVPDQAPEIAWRAGLDLNPVDLSAPDEASWLETLVWPGNPSRAERLRAAIAIAREDPPRVVRGDLLADLPPLAATAPADATLVIFHSAVLAYVTPEVRKRFAEQVKDLGAVWIANEFPRVLPDVAAKLPKPTRDDRFLLAVDADPVAVTGPHGQVVEWFG